MKQTYSLMFWINRNKMSNNLAPIYCRITINGKRTEISMRRSIDPNKWIVKAGMAKGSSEEIRTLNSYLDMVKSDVYLHYVQLSAKGVFITGELLKNLLFGNGETEKTLIEIFNYHNDQMKERIGIDVVKQTHGKFVTVLSKLEDFLKKKKKRTDIYLKELDHKFVTDFEHYLKVEDKIGHNTVMKYIRNLKKVLNMALQNDWIHKNPFNEFKCSSNAVIRQILDESELYSLANIKFEIARLEEVRDIFLFCCYTGYAFVDVEKLKKEDVALGIDGDRWIFTTRTKTNTVSNVPLLPQAQAIIDKYKDHPYCEKTGHLLPVKSNQKMNAYLKEIAALCKIKKELTMHIARHTFATTVTLSNGVPIETVSKMLGHTKLATTQIYAKVLEHKVSDDMQKLKSLFLAKTSPSSANLTGS